MGSDLFSRASACGKLIVCGEHAVVYGMPALALGLPDGLTLHARPAARHSDPLTLAISDWDLNLNLETDRDHPVAQAIRLVLDACDGPRSGWNIVGESNLPARAGLGSSATLSVALARLVYGQDADLERVVAASMVGERVFHGNPSGIDSEMAARGGILRYQRGERSRAIEGAPPLHLVILPSRIPRSTAHAVATVRSRLDRHPLVVRPILDSIGALVDEAIGHLIANNLVDLGELLQMNHELLGALGVSSPPLDELVAKLISHHALGAKLTGAGQGGCVFGLFAQAQDVLELDGQSAICVTIATRSPS